MTMLLASTFATANHQFHYNRPGYFGNFWHDFDRQLQNFDRRMDNLRQYQLSSQSKQYFDKDNNNYVIDIEITNFNKQDLTIEYKNHALIIYGNKDKQDKSPHHTAHSFNRFYNAFSLPDDANVEAIEAEFKNNHLTINIPKLDQPKPSMQTIEIK